MTDDQLERALDALAMEEPPAGLHARIMAATVYRPAPPLSTLEIWMVGTLLALASWSAFVVAGPAGPQIAVAIETFFRALLHAIASGTGVWLVLGIGATLWITLFTVPTRPATLAGR